MAMGWAQDRDVSGLQRSQILRMPVDDRYLIVGQQGEKAIRDEMLWLPARARARLLASSMISSAASCPVGFCAVSEV